MAKGRGGGGRGKLIRSFLPKSYKGIIEKGETLLGIGWDEAVEQWALNHVFGINDYAWESYATSIIEATRALAGNPGQEAIITEELIPFSTRYISYNDKEFSYIDYRSSVLGYLGEEKYNAIDIIIENLVEGLNNLHHSIYGNAGANFAVAGAQYAVGSYARKLTAGMQDMPKAGRPRSVYWQRHVQNLRQLSDLDSPLNRRALDAYNPNTRYGTLRQALSIYRSNAIRNYKRQFPLMYNRGIEWNSYTAAAARNRSTATNFLRNNPNGTIKPLGNLVITSSYRAAAKRNGVILP